jgi:hypothetical protein
VRIQYFDFSSCGEATGSSVAGTLSGGSELALAPWEGNTIRRDGMATSVGGEVASGRGKGGDDTSSANVNLPVPKNEEDTRGRFSCYKWMVKI